MRIKAIINPSAGKEKGKKEFIEAMERLRADGIVESVDFLYTKKQHDAERFAAQADSAEYDLVLAAGGDGTAHEVVNGMMQGKHKTPLLLFAAGTVNDFAQSMQLPRDSAQMEKLLRSHCVRAIDLGKVRDRYFLNVCAGGMLTDVAYTTSRESKALLGRLAYIVKGAVQAPREIFNPYDFRFVIDDDEIIEDEFYLFLVANSNSVGGFNKIMPAAKSDDGLLDFIAVRSDIKDLFPIVPLIQQIRQGDHLDHPSVIYRQGRSFKAECLNQDVVLDLDGEKGDPLPAEVTAVHQCLNLLVPKD